MHEALDTKPNVASTVEQLLATSRTFSSLVHAHIRKIPADAEVRQRDAETILQDSIDIVLQEAAHSQPVPTSRCANVAIWVEFEDDSDQEDEECSLSIAYMHAANLRSGDALPVVSLPEDKYRVYAILDEGCNSTCHTTAWAEHAARVYSGMGLTLGELTGPQKCYSGVGSQKSKGKRNLALAIELDRPLDNIMQGSISSNELGGDGFYMLLSLKAQATLGLVGDVEAGTCLVKHTMAYTQMLHARGLRTPSHLYQRL